MFRFRVVMVPARAPVCGLWKIASLWGDSLVARQLGPEEIDPFNLDNFSKGSVEPLFQ